MTVLDIVTLPDPNLRRRTRPVTSFDADLQTLIDDMIETMRQAPGVGLAAPQVGRNLSLTVIETPADLDEEGEEIEDSRRLYVIANPEIAWRSPQEVDGVEGCLSIPGYVGEVSRAVSIRVRAQDRRGKQIKLRLSDWPARIFQHEIDHLGGVLFIDRLTAPENLWTEAEYYEGQDDDDGEVQSGEAPAAAPGATELGAAGAPAD